MQDEGVYRYWTGKCSPEEEQQIQEWYQQDPENHQRDIDRVRLVFESVLVHRRGGEASQTYLDTPQGGPIFGGHRCRVGSFCRRIVLDACAHL